MDLESLFFKVVRDNPNVLPESISLSTMSAVHTVYAMGDAFMHLQSFLDVPIELYKEVVPYVVFEDHKWFFLARYLFYKKHAQKIFGAVLENNLSVGFLKDLKQMNCHVVGGEKHYIGRWFLKHLKLKNWEVLAWMVYKYPGKGWTVARWCFKRPHQSRILEEILEMSCPKFLENWAIETLSVV